MTQDLDTLASTLRGRFGERVTSARTARGELTLEVRAGDLIEVATALRDDFHFELLVDLCGVDYLGYGIDEWVGRRATGSGFSRGVRRGMRVAAAPGAGGANGPNGANGDTPPGRPGRFAVVCHLLSLSANQRLRVRSYCEDDEAPLMPSLIEVWASANWYEREAFDLYGILFDGHPDLRRLLTDYGFIGHPFRKDFPLSGHVEVRYDPARGRVAYEPVSIEPRTLVPKVIRDDHRYVPEIHAGGSFRDAPPAESADGQGKA